MKTPYRIGVIGLGQRIAHVLRRCEEVGWKFEIVGDMSIPRRSGCRSCRTPASRRAVPTADIDALLADGPFDLVMIGSPNHLHYEHLLAAFDAGFPIFCEKPIVRDGRRKPSRWRGSWPTKKTPPLYIGLVMRSMPIVREVIARVDAGATRRDSSRWTRPSICRPSMAAISRATGGASRNGAAHSCSTRSATISIFSAGSSARALRGWRASAAGASSTPAAANVGKTY